MKILYSAEATATGDGRNGHVTSSDGILDLALSRPKELRGPGGSHTNPEQLFAAGYSACFHSALKRMARESGANADGSTVTANVGLGMRPDGIGFALAVELQVTLPELDRPTAEDLVAKADQVCPYSNAIRNNVNVQLSVV